VAPGPEFHRQARKCSLAQDGDEVVIALDLVMAAAVPVTVALLGVLAAVAVIDLRSFRIPDVLSLPLIAAGLMLAPPP
jgi:hypothetical protein